MQPLLKLNDPAQFAAGMFADTPDNQPSLWRDADNVVFLDGQIEKSRGYAKEFDLEEPATGMTTANISGVPRVYVGAGSKVYKRDGALPDQIGSGFHPNGIWSMVPFGTWLFATNNVNPPQIWKNTGVLVDWPTCPFPTAKIVRKLEVFPILFKGQEVAWPSYNDPEDFAPGPGKRAGLFFIRDLDGDVMAAEPLGENMLIFYSNDQYGYMSFVGGETAMSIKVAASGGIGAVGPNAVAPCGRFHLGLGRKGIWMFDGNSWDYIMAPAVKKWFNSQIDWTKSATVSVLHEERDQAVSFFFECLDGTRKGLMFNYGGLMQGRWTKLNMPITAASDQSAFRYPLIGTANSVSSFGNGSNMNGAAMPTRLLSAPLDMGSTDRLKRWQMFETHFKNNGPIEFRVGYSDSPAGAIEWTDWAQVQNENWLEDRESILISVEFRNQALGSTWSLSGMEFHGVVTGRRR